jgi:hypothetical protein
VLSFLLVATLLATIVLTIIYGIPTSQENWDGPLVAAGLTLTTFTFSVVGMLISFKRPGNRLGWVTLGLGLGLAVTILGGELKIALQFQSDPLPGATTVVWLDNWIWTIPIGLLGTLFVLLFPDGYLPSRKWAPVAWLSVVGIILGCGSGALEPGPLSDTPDFVNPYGLEGADGLLAVLNLGFVLIPLCFVASAVAMVKRFRRARGDERQQLKWFVYAASILALTFGFYMLAPLERNAPLLEGFISFAFAGLPAATGIAILKHRLYDIDRVISRTITYGLLTTIIVVTYGLFVLVLPSLMTAQGERSDLVVAVATLLVAGLFHPARHRIQDFVDRRFYRNRFDAQRTLEAFSARLRDEVKLEEVTSELLDTVHETVRPSHASLWLRPGDGA